MSQIEKLMLMAPVIPVLVIDNLAEARPVAEALVAGGLKVIEVTLRTRVAFDAIRRMQLVPGAIVGAGTVTTKAQLDAALSAGAEFIVSPGLSPALGDAAVRSGAPFLPGVATPSEVMLGLDLGLRHFKFFPAVANGGIPALKSLSGPFGQVRFCPTGGITARTAPDWLMLEEVLCVGGSWVAPKGAAPEEIQRLAAEAAGLRPPLAP